MLVKPLKDYPLLQPLKGKAMSDLERQLAVMNTTLVALHMALCRSEVTIHNVMTIMLQEHSVQYLREVLDAAFKQYQEDEARRCRVLWR
jgi:DNA integrity scanning protein DisA with diadenylate cyclase activity